MSPVYIGVDPGKKGALALMNGKVLEYSPMPSSLKGVYEFFAKASMNHTEPITVVLEKATAMPKQGVTSMFTFGAGYGALQMAAVASGCRLVIVAPQEWKKKVLAGTDRSKDASIRTCEYLFPDVSLVPHGCRKPHDGIAEAILLAEYGRRMNL